MKCEPNRLRSLAFIAALLLGPLAGPATLWADEKSPSAQSPSSPTPGRDGAPSGDAASTGDQWTHTVDLVLHGDFDAARLVSESLPKGALTDEVQEWLAEYARSQAKRKEMNRADFEMYVRYAKERHERKEYALALRQAIQAADNLDDSVRHPQGVTLRDELLNKPWLNGIVNDALAEGGRLRKEGDWEKAWEIYYYLKLLFEREPRYQKLERECVTHLRLNRMFEKDAKWEEPIRGITRRMAERAFEHIDKYYHEEPAPFREMLRAGLEQLLLLAQSESAQQNFEGLKSETDRTLFVNRIQARLDQVVAAPRLDRRAAVGYFSRTLDINRQTVDLPENLVVFEFMRGAFEPLDDFTSIIWPAGIDEFNKHTQGDFVGVGISITKNRDDEILVLTPLANTPAFRAGIQAGDIIIAVNGKSIEGLSLNKTVETITGPKGTDVTLTIRRGIEEIDFTLRRQQVVIETVTGVERKADDPENWDFWIDRENGIAFVRVDAFAKNTVEILQGVISDLRRNGLKGLILDLRGNPGGLLDAAEDMASLFLPRNAAVHSIRGRLSRDNKKFITREDGPFTSVPLAVLVDESSASASEIVSGAIRDNRRGVVVGARTYGKFSVQNLIRVSTVPPAALKITTARYYLPSGVSLHRTDDSPTWGVEPDIPVRLVRKEKNKVRLMQRKRQLLGPTNGEEDDDEPIEAEEAERDETVTAEGDEGAPAGGGKADAAEGKEPGAEDEAAGEGGGNDEDKLPPLEQPDENDRPDVDPQLDTVLLLMRVTLLGRQYPTLATANPPAKPEPHRE